MQEQLTRDIATGLTDELGARAVLVQVTATHPCEGIRGVETTSKTMTRTTVGHPAKTERARFQQAGGNTGEESE